MRILAVTLSLLLVAILPTPGGASHDPSDDFIPINLGDDRVFYIDDSVPPMIYREDNGVAGFQRGIDNSGHLPHGNPDERIF